MQSDLDYLSLLEQGEAKAILDAFGGTLVIDDPRAGRVEGRQAAERFIADTAAWLDHHSARGMRIATTKNDQRAVQEWVLNLDIGEEGWNLPVAVVLDYAGGDLSEIRVYHSLWPIDGSHKVRPPILKPDPSIALQGAPGDYQRALAAGDVEGVLAAYEPTATTREPSGGPYAYTGIDEIRRIYSMMLAEGGIGLEFCTATDDGAACAIEYNALSWGGTSLPPQAGVAVYARGASGRIAAARIYDDVEPPASADSTQA